ncbi:CpsD/CapB family tyrosine-protein kinase [Clostridium sp. SM-530-WT-3G]|uniref:CpsD/CapB family tyrosine-protein kinase n=1 Tax=Clostridium sp. SM-530-WT-3G TaxID=2725303 RepID=UPI00145CDAA6|nr:CpsD/CapB family tyrosine-protein kinase [Clostridium sp. SM-530-WT-3G]NME83729.1 CpsD/CapB family tyrosine-protein kinase [Clostridium sp. SM-530-WT-3G]
MFFKSKLQKAIENQTHKGFIVEGKPKSVVSEAYRTLRTNIQYSSYDKKIQTIVVTSAEAAEGKSTVSGNLALTFAQSNNKVILVDCDLRKPSLHKKFQISNLIGLSEVILGKESIEHAIQKRNDNLYVLTSGKIPPNPSEMLASSAMNGLLNLLKEQFDVIILDSAPICAVTDAQVLSTRADGTIIVTRAERTKRDRVVEAKMLLDKVGANILGVVLQAVENTKGKYYYYYGSDNK